MVPERLSTVPSPQTTFRLLTVPSGSEAEMVRVIEEPVETVVDDSVKLTTGGRSVIVLVEVVLAVSVALSVTVRVTR